MLNAYCVNLEVTMNEKIKKMTKTMKNNMLQCFSETREHKNMDTSNFNSGSPRDEVSRDDDFVYTIFPRFEAPVDTHLANLRGKIDLPIFSLRNILS